MLKDIGSKTRQGVLWTVFFHSVEYVLNFGSGIVLARLLFPEDFGLMGLATIAIQFARRLANFGFGSVLVWLKDAKEEHYDTIYITNLFLMSLVCAFLFFSAPYYASFFDNDRLGAVLRVIAFDFILRAFSSVPQAILKRHMNFRLLGLAQAVGKFSTIISSVALAIAGFGVWSLVIGTLIGSSVERFSVVRFARRHAGWRPKLRFRLWALRDCFAFGSWIYASTFVGWGADNVDYFFIGKFLGVAQLGFYERAFRLMSFPRKQIMRTINSVLFSSYSGIQDDSARLCRGMLRVVTYLSFVAFPLMIWLFFIAPSFIPVVYGAKWSPAVLPLQIMCLSGLLESYSLIFPPLLRARGLVGHHTRREFIYFVVLSASVLLTVRWGISGVAWGIVAASAIHLGLMLQIALRHLPFTLGEFFKAQVPAITYGVIQIAVLYAFQTFAEPVIGKNSVYALICYTVLSGASLLCAHLVIRFRGVDDIFREWTKELKKFARSLPLLHQIGMLQKQD